MKNEYQGKSFLIETSYIKENREISKMFVEFKVKEVYEDNSFLAESKYGKCSKVFRVNEVYKWLRK
jgi:hypothetical protein